MKTRKQSLKSLQRLADKLYQVKLIRQKPISAVSGQPTEVIHHFIYKSQSAYLRYDYDNGVPLTNKEHNQHHLSGDPMIVAKIIKHYGQAWVDDLQERRRFIQKTNKAYLKTVIEELQS
jgi:hypothetical protein